MTEIVVVAASRDRPVKEFEAGVSRHPHSSAENQTVRSTDQAAPQMKAGDLIEGIVRKILSQNKALVSVLDRDVALVFSEPRAEGAKIEFMVVRVGAQIELMLSDEEGSRLYLPNKVANAAMKDLATVTEQLQPAGDRAGGTARPGVSAVNGYDPSQRSESLLREPSIPGQGLQQQYAFKAADAMLMRTQVASSGPLRLTEGEVVQGTLLDPGPMREAMAEIGGKKFSVLLTGASAGQLFSEAEAAILKTAQTFTVVRTEPALLLAPSKEGGNPPFTAARNGLPGETAEQRPLLAGDKVSARIVEPGIFKGAVVDLGGRLVKVNLSGEGSTGREYLFRVVSTGPVPEMSIIGRAVPATVPASTAARTELMSGFDKASPRQPLGDAWKQLADALKEALGNTDPDSPLRPKLTALAGILRQSVYSGPDEARPDFFRNFLVRTGQTLEPALARMLEQGGQHPVKNGPDPENVRSLVQDIVHTAGNADSGAAKSTDLQHLTAAAGAFRDSVESGQVANSSAFHGENTLFFHIPFGLHNHVSTGYLSLKLPARKQEGKGGDGEFLVVFFLDLTNLGGLRVDAAIGKNERIRINVMTEDKEVLPFVNKHLPELGERLEALGFGIEYMNAVSAPRSKLEEVCQEELRAGMLQTRINVVA